MTREVLILWGIGIGLILLGMIAGKINESRHYKSIHEREQLFLQKPAISSRKLDPSQTVQSSALAYGSVVLSVDRYKRFLMGLRQIFGGEIRSYSSLLDRARREALLRMKESQPYADLYLNTRLETSTISSGADNATGSIEVLAYSTAVKL